jgi:hypothetical protein
MPDADEHRRLGDIESRKAEQLPSGTRKDAHRRKARDHESSAHSNDWRHSNLDKPE